MLELGPVDDAAARSPGRPQSGSAAPAAARSSAATHPAGVNLISRAVALLPADDPLRVELVPNVRVVQGMRRHGWADRVLTEAIEAAATSGDRRLAAHALVQRGLLRLFTEPSVTPEELIDAAERSIAVFEESATSSASRAPGGSRRRRTISRAAPALAPRRRSRRSRTFDARVDRFEEREIVEWLVHRALPRPRSRGRRRACAASALLEETAGQPVVQAQILSGQALLVAMQEKSTRQES